ncbi:MAG: hypothetical protein HOV87_13845, partial [Catenulispora sp.]|nr:hypothetical protein [Catenulispora sp.]
MSARGDGPAGTGAGAGPGDVPGSQDARRIATQTLDLGRLKEVLTAGELSITG